MKRPARTRLWQSLNAGDYWRVDGLVSVARAFGDKGLKEHMSCRPDLADVVVDLSCEFLILASNGLWTVFTNQEVVDIVHKTKDPRVAAQELVAEARNRDSEDDISCLVVQFRELWELQRLQHKLSGIVDEEQPLNIITVMCALLNLSKVQLYITFGPSVKEVFCRGEGVSEFTRCCVGS